MADVASTLSVGRVSEGKLSCAVVLDDKSGITAVWSEGHAMLGACLSRTVMSNVHDAWFLDKSNAVHVMEVLPTGNTFCVSGTVHDTKSTATLSDAVPSETDGAYHANTPVLALRLAVPM